MEGRVFEGGKEDERLVWKRGPTYGQKFTLRTKHLNARPVREPGRNGELESWVLHGANIAGE